MNQTHTWKQKVKMMLHILLPIFITQVAMQFMVFFDTVMSGNFNKENLAGVAIGASLWTPVYTGVSGIFLGVTPIVAQALGARKKDRIASSVIQSGYLAVAFGFVLILAGAFAIEPILQAMSLEPDVAEVATHYLHYLGIGVVPVLIYTVLRASIDGLGQTRVTMFITLLSFPINVLLNYMLIFGKFGFPALGGAGSGLATSITYIIIMLIAIWFMKQNDGMRELGMLSMFEKINWLTWKEVLRIGTPIGLSIFFEVSIFAIVTLLMSNYDTITIASHQAAMNFASLLYMLPLSVAMSLTILVGFEVGAKRYEDAKQYARLGIGSAIGLSALCAVLLFLFSSDVAALYNPEPEVRALTQTFLFYAIFFQLSDAIAAPIQGTLRGYKDVNAVFIIAFISYWVIGLPTGYALAEFTDLDAYGYWIGLIVGLAFGAVGLFARLAVIERKAKQGTLKEA
ncbi:MATE family efflux transporter [Paenibacillus aquistagni]|uniref:Probable multidrug resistance protein NorM n=1 Tax=Paenibacillus aquistagni TaxID=1852522 RepID=A0A1X7J8K6_9BACL|nr:MATE family efflux transporter [Paenibacillus aquistagni]SMG23985.1 multidrug resistance protein, MATE family [Paenibacillus aquistagni]